jgi:hypothetical protein
MCTLKGWRMIKAPILFSNLTTFTFSTTLPKQKLLHEFPKVFGARHFYRCSRTQGSSKKELPLYRYDRLNWANNEIRLIQILPHNPQDGDSEGSPIRCSIIQASLQDIPEYIALSYSWGDNTKNKTILLNGRRMEVTTSLDVALRHLRSSETNGHNFGSRRIWVDAISINQQDELEKTWQVQRMSHIFERADYTLVWLGPAADSSDMAMSTVRSLGASAKAAYEPIEIPTLDLFRHLSQSPHGFGLALNKILQRTWWKRIWVVQEFAVSKDVVFLCGDTTVGWEFFSRALDTIAKYRRVIMEKANTLSANDYRRLMNKLALIAGASRLFQIRSAYQEEWRMFSMWELLALKRFGMQASDSRDIVYALTGVAKDADGQHLYPDYTKQVQAVFTDVAKAFLIEGKLRTLWLCTQPRTLHNLPSWVPDWSSRWQGDTRWLSSDGGYGTSQPIFAASGDTGPDVSFSIRGQSQVLHLGGHSFDTVRRIGKSFDIESINAWHGFRGVYMALGQLIRVAWLLQRSNLTRNINHPDAAMRTIITNMDTVWSPGMAFTYQKASASFVHQLYKKYQRDIFTSRRNPSDIEGLHELSASALDILFRNHGRRPFITTKGHLGLGPAAMKTGDMIVVVRGAEIPLVLRRDNDGNSTLIGEAYVDGIMDGELLATHPEIEVFDIV